MLTRDDCLAALRDAPKALPEEEVAAATLATLLRIEAALPSTARIEKLLEQPKPAPVAKPAPKKTTTKRTRRRKSSSDK